MELKILSLESKEVGKVRLPAQFQEAVRPDLIKRAVEAIQSAMRQPYSSDPRAGKKASAKLSRRRRKYKGAYGRGISRAPRKTLTRRGTQFIWVGAFAPGTVGGRRALPPRPEKAWMKKINDKERKKAIRSALAAVVDKKLVAKRGHKVPDLYPFIVSNDFENVKKSKDLVGILQKLGLKEELCRGARKKIRAGKGKARGRKYKKAKGPLLVLSKPCPTFHAAKNIPGVDVVDIKQINSLLLAPGAHPGRLTLFTQAAVEKLQKEKLFT